MSPATKLQQEASLIWQTVENRLGSVTVSFFRMEKIFSAPYQKNNGALYGASARYKIFKNSC